MDMRPRMTGQSTGMYACLTYLPTYLGRYRAGICHMTVLTVAGAAQAGGRITASCFPFISRRTTGILLDSRRRIESTEASSL